MAFTLADSVVLIQIERRQETPAALSRAALGEALAVAAISISELSLGVLRADSLERRAHREGLLEEIIANIPVLLFDTATARIHARLYVDLAARGQMIGANDLLITATALHHGHGVLTWNLREFQRVPGLTVRQPAW